MKYGVIDGLLWSVVFVVAVMRHDILEYFGLIGSSGPVQVGWVAVIIWVPFAWSLSFKLWPDLAGTVIAYSLFHWWVICNEGPLLGFIAIWVWFCVWFCIQLFRVQASERAKKAMDHIDWVLFR